ncbi:hypothetical protein D9V86_06185 [Bacteroidetes/Chlorobi group bacterium ChocPot_Mid]|nr:MAG: hypothetical protein D9V86_06185 [Bacteroidetes/Chlorobi group bacterium ChocPot_Mid]
MPETQNIEWKESWQDDYMKWICAFANTKGGQLYIGKNDKGNVTGINNFKELLEVIPQKARDLMGVYISIELMEEAGKHYLEISVQRYDVPISFRGKYYIRSGSTTLELKGTALHDFILRKTGKTWDDIIEPKATYDDIDANSIKKYLNDVNEANRISVEKNIKIPELLLKLRLSEDNKLKRAAIVLFGKDPGRFYNNLSVKIGKFGEDDADLKHQEVMEGNLIQLKEKIPEILNLKFFIKPIDFTGMRRTEKDQYPVMAIREMIFNALVHRNYLGSQTQIRLYDNSFSIWNDGELPEGISNDDLWKLHTSKPRNPLIADICFKGGYIDSWGRGTIKIIDACKEAELPTPIFAEEFGGFTSKIYMNIFTEEILHKMGLNPRQIKAVLWIKERGNINNSEYQKVTNIAKPTATRDLAELIEKYNLIYKEGKVGSGTKYFLKSN